MQGVDDALSRLEGVEHFSVDLQQNLVEIEVRRGSRFDVADVPRAVRGAGFRPGRMWVRTVRDGAVVVLQLDTRMPNPKWEPATAPGPAEPGGDRTGPR